MREKHAHRKHKARRITNAIEVHIADLSFQLVRHFADWNTRLIDS